MMGSLYGGITYPNSPFIYDKVYNSLKEANQNANNDGVLLGRYIFIQYVPGVAFSGDEQDKMIRSTLLEGDKEVWKSKYIEDEEINYDGTICRKVFSNNFSYIPVVKCTSSYLDLTNRVDVLEASMVRVVEVDELPQADIKKNLIYSVLKQGEDYRELSYYGEDKAWHCIGYTTVNADNQWIEFGN